MKKLALALVLLPGLALANDHNNIDPGRPLRFEDASSIAFGERVIEFGLFGSRNRYGAIFEFKQGFALNQEWGLAISPAADNNGQTRLDHLELSYLHAFRREIDDNPAFAYRLNFGLNEDEKAETRFRIIATKTLGQYDKLHLNLDASLTERDKPSFAAILGYSTPLGYPRRFDQTLVSEVSFEEHRTSFGLGLRQQLDPQTTFDVGIQAGFKGEAVLKLGYARSF